MDKAQVYALMKNCNLPDSCTCVELRETHISWIILTDHYAFKIKRPVKLPFLDFSSLEKRKHFCERELELNKRLAPQMYLRVISLTRTMVAGSTGNDEIIEYAVMMKKMDNGKEMGALLQNDLVNGEDVDKLADKIAHFHQGAEVIDKGLDTGEFQENVAELLDYSDFIEERIGGQWLEKIEVCIEKSKNFLEKNHRLMDERIDRGLKKDCHGDLSSHNIFLYDDPVIFDCIEFNEEFRHIDVLNEIAFLCTEFDFYDQRQLGERFYQRYLAAMGLTDNSRDRGLLSFFKSYRANIRAKVNILHVKSGAVENSREKDVLADIRKYIDLMFFYLVSI